MATTKGGEKSAAAQELTLRDRYDRLYKGTDYNVKVNERQRAWLIVRLREIAPVQRAIDFGCGVGAARDVLDLDPSAVKASQFVDFSEECGRRHWDGDDRFVCGDVCDVQLDPADLAICHDVLEHIPEERVHLAIANIRAHCRGAASFTIANHPDHRDGFDLHVTKRSFEWWQARILKRFNVIEVDFSEDLYLFWCAPR